MAAVAGSGSVSLGAAGVATPPGPTIEGAPHAPAVRFDLVKSAISTFRKPDPTMHAENRQRVLGYLRARYGDEGVAKGATFVFEGGKNPSRGRSDHEPIFRQESSFYWLYGCNEPDFYGVIQDDGKSIIFAPDLPAEYAVWMGPLKTPAQIAEQYGCDECKWTHEMAAYLAARKEAAGGAVTALQCMEGVQTDSGAAEPMVTVPTSGTATPAPAINASPRLFEAVIECRAHKTSKEIALLRHNIRVSSDGHLCMMREAKPDMFEFQLEAIFKFWSQFVGGTRQQAYTYICGSGSNAAVLHYGHAGAPNSKQMKDGETVLCDCGNELECYASDITTTFPVGGKFSDDQKVVYSAVLDALVSVEKEMKEGCKWIDMQSLAYTRILTGLKAAGLLTGEVDDMMKANLGAVFMPHGLGHFLGIDTHDCGGYPDWKVGRVTRDAALGKEAPADKNDALPEEYECTPRSPLSGYKSVRTARILAASNVITVEPGCYFIDPLLDAALASPTQGKFIVKDVLESRFRGTGGVRLEDNVLITKDGIENFVKVPRTVDDVEKACRGEVSGESDFKLV